MTILRTSSRRFLQTVRPTPTNNLINSATILSLTNSTASRNSSSVQDQSSTNTSSWSKHSLPSEFSIPQQQPTKKSTKQTAKPFSLAKQAQPFGKSDPSKPFASRPTNNASSTSTNTTTKAFTPSSFAFDTTSYTTKNTDTQQNQSQSQSQTQQTSTDTQSTTTKSTKPRRKLRPRKAAINLTPTAVEHLKKLLDQPNPQMIRVGVKNRGCSGLTYHLEYVEKPGKFDEEVAQDGVKVLIDSKALFSIIGSEMDWVDDKLSSRFVFSNPNSKGQCGCGESFMV